MRVSQVLLPANCSEVILITGVCHSAAIRLFLFHFINPVDKWLETQRLYMCSGFTCK